MCDYYGTLKANTLQHFDRMYINVNELEPQISNQYST